MATERKYQGAGITTRSTPGVAATLCWEGRQEDPHAHCPMALLPHWGRPLGPSWDIRGNEL